MREKKILFLMLFCLVVSAAGGLAGTPGYDGENGTRVEKYHYEAVPIGKENETEQIEVTLSFEPDGIVFVSRSISEKAEERIRIRMSREGDLQSGTRSLGSRQGSLLEQKIRREGDRVYVEQVSGSDRKSKIFRIPDRSTLAVEASLFVLLRFFPYGSTAHWNLFMIDFSGKSVAATARQTGVEHISVRGNNFPCYRMEVLFHVRVFEPEAICWVTAEEPHVVIKSIGKRGILTPKYVTSLLHEQSPAAPQADKETKATEKPPG